MHWESHSLKVNTRKTKVMVSGSKDELFKSKIDPCGVCGRRVMANLVLCTKSRNWVHGKYAKINRATARLAMHLVCSKCKGIMEGTVDSIEKLCNDVETAPINFCLNVLVRSPTPLGWVEMAVGLPEGSSYPRHSPSFFSLCCPLNDRRKAAQHLQNRSPVFTFSSLLPYSCPSSSPHSSFSPDEQ